MSRGISKLKTNRREELQRMLGEGGTVLPRHQQGNPDHPAPGWYAEHDGELTYLGDNSYLAAVGIDKLLKATQTSNGHKPRRSRR